MTKLCDAIGAYVSRILQYFGQRVRLINEDNWKPWVIAQLNKYPTMFALERDWAMKYLSVKRRKMQLDLLARKASSGSEPGSCGGGESEALL